VGRIEVDAAEVLGSSCPAINDHRHRLPTTMPPEQGHLPSWGLPADDRSTIGIYGPAQITAITSFGTVSIQSLIPHPYHADPWGMGLRGPDVLGLTKGDDMPAVMVRFVKRLANPLDYSSYFLIPWWAIHRIVAWQGLLFDAALGRGANGQVSRSPSKSACGCRKERLKPPLRQSVFRRVQHAISYRRARQTIHDPLLSYYERGAASMRSANRAFLFALTSPVIRLLLTVHPLVVLKHSARSRRGLLPGVLSAPRQWLGAGREASASMPARIPPFGEKCLR